MSSSRNDEHHMRISIKLLKDCYLTAFSQHFNKESQNLKFWPNMELNGLLLYQTKPSKSVALSIYPCRHIRLPISICLDLSASFAMIGSLASSVFVLMLLMRGYFLKCAYSIPKFPIFIQH